MPVPETSSSGPSLSSGVAFVAGLTVTFAALTHHAKKAAAKKHHDQLTTFEQNQMTTYEHILEGQTSPQFGLILSEDGFCITEYN